MSEESVDVSSLLTISARERPNQPALVSGASHPAFSTLSFSQLDQRVSQASRKLFQAGISAGDKTLLFVNPGPGLIIWAFALFRLGAIPVIIDPGMGLRSFLASIKRTQPIAMVGISRAHWLSRFMPRPFHSIRRRYLVRPGYYGAESTDPLPRPDSTRSSNDLAAIVFTSGSTGTPKGVRYLNQNFSAQIHSLRSEFDMEEGEIDLTTLPIFGLFNPALGITSVLPEIDPRHPARADPKKLLNSLIEFDITTAFASPVIGKKVALECLQQKIRLPKMRRFLLAGAPVPPSLAEQLGSCLPNGRVIVPYGATEALPVSSTTGQEISSDKELTLAGAGSLVGCPIPGARVQILPVSRAPLPPYQEGFSGLPPGEVGEICVSGPMVTAGYDRMPGATCDARFTIGTSEYHRMGDLGYLDEKQNLRFLGRKVECVQTSTGPIETERCEPAINQLSCVEKCALVGLGVPPSQEPCLVVEPSRKIIHQRGEMELRKEILQACDQFFPQFKISRVFFERKIPVDSRHNAKIHRLTLSRKWTKKILHKPNLGRKA